MATFTQFLDTTTLHGGYHLLSSSFSFYFNLVAEILPSRIVVGVFLQAVLLQLKILFNHREAPNFNRFVLSSETHTWISKREMISTGFRIFVSFFIFYILYFYLMTLDLQNTLLTHFWYSNTEYLTAINLTITTTGTQIFGNTQNNKTITPLPLALTHHTAVPQSAHIIFTHSTHSRPTKKNYNGLETIIHKKEQIGKTETSVAYKEQKI